MRKVKNFARFYACLNGIQTVDKEDLKESLISQFTDGRTLSLREMSVKEYNAMCDSIDPKMEQTLREKSLIASHRSAVLRRMQQLGVNTADWNAVDRFCLEKRIAGKKFYELTTSELKAMIPKLIAISKKPKNKESPKEPDNQKNNLSDEQIAYLIKMTSNIQLTN